jgi:O-methyltransferase involved in polyketide biosynthesis
LEGFTGYLTEEELNVCFNRLTSLSGPNSRLLATFIGTGFKHGNFNLHKFRTDDPLGYVLTQLRVLFSCHDRECFICRFVAPYGWCGSTYPFNDLARRYDREWASKACLFEHYQLVDVARP